MDQREEFRLDRTDPATGKGMRLNEGPVDPRGGVPPKLAALRFKLGRQAKQEPKFRFYALYGHLMRVDVLETAYASVAASHGSKTPGVDGVTIDHIVHAEDRRGAARTHVPSPACETRLHPEGERKAATAGDPHDP